MSGKRQDRGAAGKRAPGPGKPARQSGGMAGAHRGKLVPKAGGESPAAPRAPAKKPFKPAGFRHAGTAAAPWLKEASAKRGFAEPRILTDWDDILGPALAPVCRPVKVTYSGRGFGATLIVLASGARAPEVQMLLPRIIERVNGHYGYRAVSRIKVTQTDRSLDDRAPGAAGGATQSDPRASASPENRPDRRDMTGPTDPHADAAAAAVQDPGLSAALDRLGRSRAAHGLRAGAAEQDAGREDQAAHSDPRADAAARSRRRAAALTSRRGAPAAPTKGRKA